jgi:hypothetical protein
MAYIIAINTMQSSVKEKIEQHLMSISEAESFDYEIARSESIYELKTNIEALEGIVELKKKEIDIISSNIEIIMKTRSFAD